MNIYDVYSEKLFSYEADMKVFLCRGIENADSGFFTKESPVDDFCVSLSQLCVR